MGIFAALLGAVGQTGGYVLSKMALKTGIDPLSATVIRVSTAAVFIWMIAAAERATTETLAALKDRRASAFMAAGAFCGPFLGVTLSLTAIRFIDTGVAASITAIYPIFAMLIAARFHGETAHAARDARRARGGRGSRGAVLEVGCPEQDMERRSRVRHRSRAE